MFNPFRRRESPAEIPPESRAGITPSGDFTKDTIALAILGAGGPVLRGTAASLEIAAGQWQRGFAVANVSPLNARTLALTPDLLGHVGRYLLKYGQAVFEIQVMGGAVVLNPAQQWNVYGGPSPDTWEWELTFSGPSYTEMRRLPAPRVLNLTYAVDHSAPWVGVGPLNAAGLTQAAVVNVDTAIAQESATARGYLFTVPDIGQATELTGDLRGAKGGLQLVPSVASDTAWGAGIESKPADDWAAKRFGFTPPQPLTDLRAGIESSILAAAGIDPAVLSQSDGTAKREAFRQFLHLTLNPVAAIVAAQIGRALNLDVSLDFTSLGAADLAARGRYFKQLRDGGMSLEDAASAANIPITESSLSAPAPAPALNGAA